MALDVTALQTTLQTLLKQVELSADDALPVRIWLKQLRLLAEESEGMGVVDAETIGVLAEIDPDFLPKVVETIFLVSLADSEDDFRTLFQRLDEEEQLFQKIINHIHQGAIRTRSMTFKQHFAHNLITMKRLLYRLRTLTDARSRFPSLFDASAP